MTVLAEFTKLESIGLWRPDHNAQRREVIVLLGDATLVISDTAGRPLTHWSLPAVQRANGGQRPALFSPGPDASETLEIDDDLMIDAMEKVAKTVKRRQHRSGRVRTIGLAALAAGVVGLCVVWLPDALIREAENTVPMVKRTEIGEALLGHIERVTGETCDSPLGTAALARVHRRALGPDAVGRVVVVPSGPDTAVYLPGGLIAMNRDLIEDTEDPAVVAGHIIAAAAQARETDPLGRLLRDGGVRTTFTLLITTQVNGTVLARHAEALFAHPPERASDITILVMFAKAGISSTPFAYAIDITGEETSGLIEEDPMQGTTNGTLLDEADWISLQGICS